MKEHAGEIVEYTIEGNNLKVELPDDFWLKDNIFYYGIPRVLGGFKEILIAPIAPKNWKFAWEFRFSIKNDGPGVIYTITDIIQENEINIFKHEGYTPHENIEYSFWVLASIEKFISKHNAQQLSAIEISKLLLEKLNNSFQKKEKEQSSKGIQSAGIRLNSTNCIELLYENSDNFAVNTENEIQNKELAEFFSYPVSFLVKDKIAQIEYSRLLNSLGLGVKYKEGSKFFGTIFTDLEQRNFYILRFFNPNQKIIFYDVRHKHEVGVIHKLAREISRNKGYNVLYNRAIITRDSTNTSNSFSDLSHWYVLMEIADGYDVNELFNRLNSSHLTPKSRAISIINHTDNVILDDEYQIVKKISKRKYFIPIIKKITKTTFQILIYIYIVFIIYNKDKAVEIWENNTMINFILTMIIVIIAYNGLLGGYRRFILESKRRK